TFTSRARWCRNSWARSKCCCHSRWFSCPGRASAANGAVEHGCCARARAGTHASGRGKKPDEALRDSCAGSRVSIRSAKRPRSCRPGHERDVMSADEAEGGRVFFSSTGRSLVEEDEIVVLSVGVDIGSSTSHLVFSRIVLERLDSRYVVTTREA